ncbi:MAG: type III secretion protein, partial [Candidatus Accumulibacter sp.]|nr:type III secretion protein [Accumulibacter sp.]
MRYPLSGLLAIRDFRRDAAAKAVRAAEAAERAARKEAETRREAWEAYKLWRCDEVERRYRGIMGACLSGKDLDEFKAGLAQLGDEE